MFRPGRQDHPKGPAICDESSRHFQTQCRQKMRTNPSCGVPRIIVIWRDFCKCIRPRFSNFHRFPTCLPTVTPWWLNLRSAGWSSIPLLPRKASGSSAGLQGSSSCVCCLDLGALATGIWRRSLALLSRRWGLVERRVTVAIATKGLDSRVDFQQLPSGGNCPNYADAWPAIRSSCTGRVVH